MCSFLLRSYCYLHVTLICAIWTIKSSILQNTLREQEIMSHQAAQAQNVCDKVFLQAYFRNSIYLIHTSPKFGRKTETFLYNCQPARSFQILDLEGEYEELNRWHYTHNFWLLPGQWTLADGLWKLRRKLNVRQKCKHCHSHVFLWAQRPLDELFQLLWSKGILNVIAFNNSQIQECYTYEPFTAQGFLVRRCKNSAELFYDKLTNLHQKPLRISMFPDNVRARPRPDFERNGYDGVDGQIARTIVELLNATANFKPAAMDVGELFLDFGFDRVDVAFNVRDMIPSDLAEALYASYMRKQLLVVPAGRLLPQSLIYRRVFSENWWYLLLFWVACLAFYLLELAAVQLIGRYTKTERLPLWSIVDIVLKLQFGGPVHRFTCIRSLRPFITSLMLCGFVVTNIYFAIAASSFQLEIYEPNIDRFDEYNIHFNNTPILFGRSWKTYYTNNYVEHFVKQLVGRTPVYFNFPEYSTDLDTIKEAHNVSFVLQLEVARHFLAQTYNNVSHRPMYHAVKQPIFTTQRTYLVPNGSPFHYKLQTLIIYLFEHGFMEHWWTHSEVHRQHTSWTAKQYYNALGSNLEVNRALGCSSVANIDDVVPLDTEILEIAFYFWLFGGLLSLIVFLCELFCGKGKLCCTKK